MLRAIVAPLLFLSSISEAQPAAARPPAGPSLKLIHQFNSSTWLENLFVLANGSVLATEITRPNLWLLNTPKSTPSTPAILVHSFAPDKGLLGIEQSGPNELAIISGTYDISTASSTPGTYAIHTLQYPLDGSKNVAVKVKRRYPIPAASILNGMAVVPSTSKAAFVLAPDSVQGILYRLDLTTGAAVPIIKDPLFDVDPTTKLLGINGVRILGIGRSTYLYFTNLGQNFLGRIAINPSTGAAASPGTKAELVQKGAAGLFDDFEIPDGKNAIVANGGSQSIESVGPLTSGYGTSEKTVIAGDLLSDDFPTSVRFRCDDTKNAFVTTAGRAPLVAGNVPKGAQLLALSL